ncbi:11184_t:CDS:2 [Paraglomus occultum]|uniref:11184_t:CDS:1 n=1 Tax=Paraglomus occultum TaxID=144539 RepID=A0A9N8WFB7_9GLOM|nr:11184_t:CDS:2 [Paraglomus occultum]
MSRQPFKPGRTKHGTINSRENRSNNSRRLRQQYQPSLGVSQLPANTGGLPTYSIPQSTNEQQNTLFTHQQQHHKQQWLPQHLHSRQRDVQAPSELFTPMQLDRQNSVEDMLGVFPIVVEPSEYVQSQVCLPDQSFQMKQQGKPGEGAAAYRDPISFRVQPYKHGKKSDIFSLGVLFWEISSGQIPCNECHFSVAEYRKRGY